MKDKVDREIVGEHVSRITKTRSGDLLIQLQKGGATSLIKDAVAAAMGTDATVMQLSDQVTPSVIDIDANTSSKEIQDALATAANSTKELVKVKSVREAYSGTQVAVVTMGRAAAIPLLKTGKVKIGWVLARVRERDSIPRCLNCGGFGHLARQCRQVRKDKHSCFLCGADDHLAARCKNVAMCSQCKEIDAPTDHRSGSAKCTALKRAQEKSSKRKDR